MDAGDDGGDTLDEWADDAPVLAGVAASVRGGSCSVRGPAPLERLAALTPRPRIRRLLCHGVLAPRAAWRSLVIRFGSESRPDATGGNDDAEEHADAVGCRHGNNYLWAELMRRSLGLDVLACPRCDGRLKLIALIDDPAVIRRLLRHLELPTEVREARPARAPTVPLLDSAPPSGGALDEVFVDDSA